MCAFREANWFLKDHSLFIFSSLLEEHLQDLCIREETRDTISPPTSPPDPAAPWYPLPLQLCPEDQDKMLLRVTRLGSRWLWWSFMFRNHQGFLVLLPDTRVIESHFLAPGGCVGPCYQIWPVIYEQRWDVSSLGQSTSLSKQDPLELPTPFPLAHRLLHQPGALCQHSQLTSSVNPQWMCRVNAK